MPAIAKSAIGDERIMSTELRDQLVMDYAQFVTFIAGRIASRLPKSISMDDLVSAGFLGLLDAIQKFDPDRDNKFKTYAEHRIRGSILDELRKWDNISRTTRDKEKNLGAARSQLRHELGREPTSGEIASHLGLTLKKFHEFRSRADTPCTSFEFDEQLIDIDGSNNRNAVQFEDVSKKECRNLLISAIDQLPEREKTILSLYYYDDLSLKEIGKIMSITESRVCQIHRRAIKRIGVIVRETPGLAITA